MLPISAMHTALFGIRENLRTFDETASRLAQMAPGAEMAEELIGLGIAEYGVRANVEVVRAADGLAGTLLNVLA